MIASDTGRRFMVGSSSLGNRYFLLRHGESEANVARTIASRLATARSAWGLTPRGREQVAAHVRLAIADGVLANVDAIVSSPFLRTRQSGDVAAEILGAPVDVDARLRERDFGEHEGGPDTRYADVWARDRQDPAHTDGGVESVASVLSRTLAAILAIEAAGAGRTVLLCTHGDVASILICAARGEDLRRHREVGALGVGELRGLDQGRV